MKIRVILQTHKQTIITCVILSNLFLFPTRFAYFKEMIDLWCGCSAAISSNELWLIDWLLAGYIDAYPLGQSRYEHVLTLPSTFPAISVPFQLSVDENANTLD